jgi:ketosteroid isomerase-like protein
VNPNLSRVRILLALAIVGVLVFLGVRMRGGAKAPEGVERAAIQKVLDDQAEAWNQGDLEGYMNGYWQDQDSPDQKLTFYSGGDKTSGWQETYERYRRKYKSEPDSDMGQVKFSEVDIQLLGGDSALVRGRWHLERKNKEPVGGLFTLLFQKKAQHWFIVHDHTSVKAPEVPLPSPGG